MAELLNHFLWGALSMACVVAGLFFLRFWRESKDRFFLLFAVAFWIFALNWIALLAVDPKYEARYSVYGIRLVAFLVIIAAILDKNRDEKR